MKTQKKSFHALESGINFFDTAMAYQSGTSEEYLGRAIKENMDIVKMLLLRLSIPLRVMILLTLEHILENVLITV